MATSPETTEAQDLEETESVPPRSFREGNLWQLGSGWAQSPEKIDLSL